MKIELKFKYKFDYELDFDLDNIYCWQQNCWLFYGDRYGAVYELTRDKSYDYSQIYFQMYNEEGEYCEVLDDFDDFSIEYTIDFNFKDWETLLIIFMWSSIFTLFRHYNVEIPKLREEDCIDENE